MVFKISRLTEGLIQLFGFSQVWSTHNSSAESALTLPSTTRGPFHYITSYTPVQAGPTVHIYNLQFCSVLLNIRYNPKQESVICDNPTETLFRPLKEALGSNKFHCEQVVVHTLK